MEIQLYLWWLGGYGNCATGCEVAMQFEVAIQIMPLAMRRLFKFYHWFEGCCTNCATGCAVTIQILFPDWRCYTNFHISSGDLFVHVVPIQIVSLA